jgi:nucleoside diphosphate kinase
LRNEFDVPELLVNSLHGPSNEEQAKRELELFFPKEQTLALIKPGIDAEKKAEIEKKIIDSGFIITSKKSESLTEDIAKEIYKNSADKPYFNDLVGLMTRFEKTV